MNVLLRLLLPAALILTGLVMALSQWHPGLERLHSLQGAAPVATADSALVGRWLGCSGLMLSDDEHSILIDPFFSRPQGLLRMALNRPITPDIEEIKNQLKRLGIEKLDAVVVSHSHHDHSMDAGVIAKLTGARLIGSDSTLNIGRGADVDAAQLEPAPTHSALQIGAFALRMIPSQHAGLSGGIPTGTIEAPLRPPARYLDYRQGGTYSIHIEHPAASILHVGSAGFRQGALQGFHADTVFLGVAMIDDLETYLQQTVDSVGATRVVPVHWDDFTRPLDAPLVPFPVVVRLDRFFDQLANTRPHVQVESWPVLEPISLRQPTEG